MSEKNSGTLAIGWTALSPFDCEFPGFPPDEPDGPIDPGPIDPGPIDPGPIDPGPIDPGPVDNLYCQEAVSLLFPIFLQEAFL
jgi:hypothetical protein